MTALAVFLGVVVGILCFFAIVIFIIWHKFKKAAKKHGLDNIKLSEVIDDIERVKEENSHTPRTLSGMTSLIMPQIVKEFNDFSENLIYNKTEKGLRAVFNSINDNELKGLDDFPLLKDHVEGIIKDNISNNIVENYSDIRFRGFAIEDYRKYNGVATVSVATAIEYYYKKSINGKIKYESRYKEQTRYSCKFIYIYDESTLDDSTIEKVIGLNCPNCGAPVRSFRNPVCKYCGTALSISKDVDVNVKVWAFSSYIKR